MPVQHQRVHNRSHIFVGSVFVLRRRFDHNKTLLWQKLLSFFWGRVKSPKQRTHQTTNTPNKSPDSRIMQIYMRTSRVSYQFKIIMAHARETNSNLYASAYLCECVCLVRIFALRPTRDIAILLIHAPEHYTTTLYDALAHSTRRNINPICVCVTTTTTTHSARFCVCRIVCWVCMWVCMRWHRNQQTRALCLCVPGFWPCVCVMVLL